MGRPRKYKFDHICPCCGKNIIERNLYKSHSILYAGGDGYIPICKDCLDKIYYSLYDMYWNGYEIEGINSKDVDLLVKKRAIRRLCMMVDVYYSDEVFEGALKKVGKSLVSCYMRTSNLHAFQDKTYENTIIEESNYFNTCETKPDKGDEGVIEIEEVNSEGISLNLVSKDTIKFFGTGFHEEDYIFLQEQYDDWTSRHECNTKSQEEMFKQICFTQLELLKATRAKADTKDLNALNATFLKQLEAAKLQPKQNHSETLSDSQTYGMLISKWETTKPISEVDEELKDVDNIGLNYDAFVRGHTAKMLGVKNAFSRLYSKVMKKYTVERPEYNDDKDSEILFDAVFGGGANIPDSDLGGD